MAVRRVGWCGLGGMGSGMSQNVLKYLLSDANGGQFARTLVVYNRDTAKSERFVESEKVKHSG
jgi:3-hydroxyisobutyrate dehydrogenase-like beta-hydroxyacid dehydrogenase